MARPPGSAPHWPRLVELLERHRVDSVFDVGANTGQYASGLRNNGWAGRIVSFEPLGAAHAALETAARDDIGWQIAPRAAVGAAASTATLNVSPEADMSSLRELTEDAAEKFASVRFAATETVPMVALADVLDDWVAPGDAIFVKSDTQGYEAEVLDGLEPAIGRIAGLQFELSLVPIYEGQALHTVLLDRLGALGFAVHLVIPGYWSRHHGRMLEYDVVCFREGYGDAQ